MVLSGNILASTHGVVGYLQPRGHVSPSSSSSSILQHLKVLHLRVSFLNLQINTLTTYMVVNFNKRLQTLISQQLYTKSLYSIHIVNTISSYER